MMGESRNGHQNSKREHVKTKREKSYFVLHAFEGSVWCVPGGALSDLRLLCGSIDGWWYPREHDSWPFFPPIGRVAKRRPIL